MDPFPTSPAVQIGIWRRDGPPGFLIFSLDSDAKTSVTRSPVWRLQYSGFSTIQCHVRKEAYPLHTVLGSQVLICNKSMDLKHVDWAKYILQG